MSDLWTYIESDGDSSDDGLSDEGITDQENPDDQEQEGVLPIPRSNPRRIIWGEQRSLIQIKSLIESSKDKISLIKHISSG